MGASHAGADGAGDGLCYDSFEIRLNYVALYELRSQNFAQLNVSHRLYVLAQKYSLDGTSSLAVRWCSYDASSTTVTQTAFLIR